MEVEAWAYDLRPGLPPEGIPREEAHRHYRPEYLDYVLRSAARAGIDMRFPSVIANTGKAHEATEFARDRGLVPPFQRAVFRAYWEEGQNIGDLEVLCRLAEGCGLRLSFERGGELPPVRGDAEALGEALGVATPGEWRSRWPGRARRGSTAFPPSSSTSALFLRGPRSTRSSATWPSA